MMAEYWMNHPCSTQFPEKWVQARWIEFLYMSELLTAFSHRGAWLQGQRTAQPAWVASGGVEEDADGLSAGCRGGGVYGTPDSYSTYDLRLLWMRLLFVIGLSPYLPPLGSQNCVSVTFLTLHFNPALFSLDESSLALAHALACFQI